MKKIIIAVVLVALIAFFFPRPYISSPGFVSPDAYAAFQASQKHCAGISVLMNQSAMAADAPGESLCFGVLYEKANTTPAPVTNDSDEIPAGKLMSIESYVSMKISDLSPVAATMGGTFYVTEITAEDGKGVVSYEDGHNAYTADFAYSMDEYKGISISSFIVRD